MTYNDYIHPSLQRKRAEKEFEKRLITYFLGLLIILSAFFLAYAAWAGEKTDCEKVRSAYAESSVLPSWEQVNGCLEEGVNVLK